MPKAITFILALTVLFASQAQAPLLAHPDSNGQRHCHHDGAKAYVRCH